MNEELLLETIRKHLNGHENHPAYQRWFDEYLYLEKRHAQRLIVDLKQFMVRRASSFDRLRTWPERAKASRRPSLAHHWIEASNHPERVPSDSEGRVEGSWDTVSLFDKKVLDFGCGTGGSSVALALEGAEVTGIEPNPLSIDVAQARIKKYSLESKISVSNIEDTARLPFQDESFDICVCYSVMEYISRNRKEFIREMWRVLKKGGALFIGGTCNGLYPIEMHSKKLFINYLPESMRKSGEPYGLSYFEILAALKPYSYEILNCSSMLDGLERFKLRQENHNALQTKILTALLGILKHSYCKLFKVPIDALTPWLDICILKK